MRHRIGVGIGVAIATSVLVIHGGSRGSGGVVTAHARPGFHCTNATIRGTYGIQMQGRAPILPPFPSGIQDVIGVVVRTYDGQGGFTQVDNIKGAVSGIVPDRPGAGTYQIDADCTGTAVFDPGSGLVIEERMVIVDIGKEIRTITSTPPPVMVSTVQKRIDHR